MMIFYLKKVENYQLKSELNGSRYNFLARAKSVPYAYTYDDKARQFIKLKI